MEILIGLLIIAVGAFCQSSCYVPINKIKDWSWESYWIVQGVFAWLILPFIGAMLAVPSGHSFFELFDGYGFEVMMTMLFGMLWGVGGHLVGYRHHRCGRKHEGLVALRRRKEGCSQGFQLPQGFDYRTAGRFHERMFQRRSGFRKRHTLRHLHSRYVQDASCYLPGNSGRIHHQCHLLLLPELQKPHLG